MRTLTRSILSCIVLTAALNASAVAEELVYFQNGQAMRVDKTRRDGKWLYLSLSADAEMGVLLRQVRKVEAAPPLPGGARGGAVAANLVQGGGAGGYVGSAPIAESYDAGDAGDEPQVAPVPDQGPQLQQQLQQQMQAAQGQDLVPRNINTRRAGRPGRP